MKTIFKLAVLAAGAAMTLSACGKLAGGENAPEREGYETLTINVGGISADISTRGAVTAANGSDKTVANVQIFIFDSSGSTIDYRNNNTGTTYSRSLRAGESYTVAALVNGPDAAAVKTASALEALALTLDAKGLSTTTPMAYAMYGKTGVASLSSETKSVTVNVESLASRVRIAKITNNLPSAMGSLTVKSVFLCNVKSQVKVGGTAVSAWYNDYGKLSDKGRDYTVYECSSVSLASAASTADSSFPHYFYTYPNDCTTPFKESLKGSSVSLSTTPQALWMTVCGTVTINGTVKTCYWTVDVGSKVGGLAANSTYDVSLVISALGSDDPAVPTTSETAAVTVKVTGWQDGGTVTETF